MRTISIQTMMKNKTKTAKGGKWIECSQLKKKSIWRMFKAEKVLVFLCVQGTARVRIFIPFSLNKCVM
jgi:hypothetical protein